MRPTASSDQVRRRLERQRVRDTGPEVAVRRELWQRGMRGYRIHWPLPFDRRRRADLAWPGRRIAVMIDGCFWHRCPKHFQPPKANADWWAEKVARNVERDRETDGRLRELGWCVLRFWEHEDPREVADRLSEQLSPPD